MKPQGRGFAIPFCASSLSWRLRTLQQMAQILVLIHCHRSFPTKELKTLHLILKLRLYECSQNTKDCLFSRLSKYSVWCSLKLETQANGHACKNSKKGKKEDETQKLLYVCKFYIHDCRGRISNFTNCLRPPLYNITRISAF